MIDDERTLVFERGHGMATLLRLYQQDAEACDPVLSQTMQDAAGWLSAAMGYLTGLRDRFDRADDVPVRHKSIATDSLDLVIQTLRVRKSLQDGLPPPVAVGAVPGHGHTIRPFVTILLLMFVLLLVNLWVMSVMGVASLSALIAALILLHWGDIGFLERRLRSTPPEPTPLPTTVRLSQPTAITVGAYAESVVRHIDAMIERDARPAAPLPPVTLNAETLAFFQDILEAKLADDWDYAVKKIARTVERVLSSEEVEVITDVRNYPAMFTIDTVIDAAKAGMLEAIRPALVRRSQCIVTGYAHRFVDA